MNQVGDILHHPVTRQQFPKLRETFKDVAAISLTTVVDSTDSLVSMFYNSTETSLDIGPETKHPVIGLLLVMFSIVTVLGNLLVIVAVVKDGNLRTVTNYLIVSLAIADVMVGGIVMPFSISHELSNQVWNYGTAWCDLWHSFDVLGSTASILNLSSISLDRYWAITDPIGYTMKMSPCRVSILITFVWLCAAGISFPAIAWWKAVTIEQMPGNVCVFTEDAAYLIFSSLVSFYLPTIVMIFVYIQIYRAARNQRRSIKSGTKVLTSNRLFGPSGVMTLRIHRGGMTTMKESPRINESTPFRKKSDSDEEESSNNNHNSLHNSGGHEVEMSMDEMNKQSHLQENSQRSMTFITKRLRQLTLRKKISKIAKEQKAAKTLGIVVGVFIICWLPFFVTNILIGVCNVNCVAKPEVIVPVFTWLGYINSGVNPIIYALSMKDFRRAFGNIICYCCPRYTFYQNRRRHQTLGTNATV